MESRDHPLRAGGHLGGHRVGAMFDSGLKMRAWPWHPAHLVSRSSLVLRRWKAGHYSTPSVEMGGRCPSVSGPVDFRSDCWTLRGRSCGNGRIGEKRLRWTHCGFTRMSESHCSVESACSQVARMRNSGKSDHCNQNLKPSNRRSWLSRAGWAMSSLSL